MFVIFGGDAMHESFEFDRSNFIEAVKSSDPLSKMNLSIARARGCYVWHGRRYKETDPVGLHCLCLSRGPQFDGREASSS